MSAVKAVNAASGVRQVKIAPAAAGEKGRGVFATAPIAPGEVVEEACTVELDRAACQIIAPTPIEDFHFRHPEDELKGLVVLGLASLCNHADAHNVETGYRRDTALGWIVFLTALRAIQPGEEITRRYACPPWFAVAPPTSP